MLSPLESELLALADFIASGLLTPSLARRLAPFPRPDLDLAIRDLLDWLSLRSILRDRQALPRAAAHPITGRLLAALPNLRNCLCTVGESLAFRIEFDPPAQRQLEDYVRDLIWHPRAIRHPKTQPTLPNFN